MHVKYKVLVDIKRRKFKIKIISSEEVLIYSPYKLTNKEAEAVINSNLNKINEIISKMNIFKPIEISKREFLYILGEKVPLKIVKWEANKLQLNYNKEEIIISMNKNIKEEELRSFVKVWYKKIAKNYLINLTAELARKNNFEINNVRVKDVKTRWGSCSSKRNINLNYKIIMAPKEVIEYVIIHELCHLKQMNHSEKFWKEVSNILPNYKMQLEHLKKFGHDYEI